MLQELVEELKIHVRFKDSTVPGDLVLIAADNPRMLVYALVEAIEPDPSRRDPWWHLSMQLLTVPPQPIVWTLREPQFTGRELFTMGGDERFMQAVLLERPSGESGDEPPANPPGGKGVRRVK